jgi:Spy/CpxP family protein refolding chaperone
MHKRNHAAWWIAGVGLAAVLTVAGVAGQQPAPPAAGTSAGQTGQPGRWGGRHAGYHRGFDHGFGMGFVLRDLNLTDAQRDQVEAIVQRHRDEFRTAADKTRQARHALGAASGAGSVDESAIRAAASALGDAEGEMAILRARVHSEIWDILTSEQRKKAEAFEQQRQQRFEQRRLERQQRSQG